MNSTKLNNTAWHLQTKKPQVASRRGHGVRFLKGCDPRFADERPVCAKLRAPAALQATSQRARTGIGPSMVVTDRHTSCGKSYQFLSTVSASFPAVGKEKKNGEAKHVKVFLWLAKRGVDMHQKEVFVWAKEATDEKRSSGGKKDDNIASVLCGVLCERTRKR